MATPGQLVEAMATALGISAATVVQYDRQLAEAGLRSKGGRGTSAAKVTPRDAANLLVAIGASPLAGPTVKEAVRTCETYGSLKTRRRACLTDQFPKLGLVTLGRLPASHSFREALSALIAAAAKGEVFQIPDPEGPLTADFLFAITFAGPEPWAEILADSSLGVLKGSQWARLVYTSPGATRRRKKRPDLHQTRRISFATIRALGKLLSVNSTDGGRGK